jgi:hypothetical protein
MAIGKDKDDKDQFDGVAEGADNSAEDDAANEKDDSKGKGFGEGRADKTKQDEPDEEQTFGKKRKGSGK